MRRCLFSVTLAFILLFSLLLSLSSNTRWKNRSVRNKPPEPVALHPRIDWKHLPQKYPVQSYIPLPTGSPESIPQIQHNFEPERSEHAAERLRRLEAVKKAFEHSWEGYRENAWRQDEVAPLSGEYSNPFGGWGATLVDSLDTLWIVGMKEEFEDAVLEIEKIDFTTAQAHTLNIFETTIRYLGGLLSAYDISDQKYDILLEKAVELGETLYAAFDTPNRMPITRWNWKNAAYGEDQEAEGYALLAEVGSLSLEFTRLSQLTGKHKWYDAISRIINVFEDAQNMTTLPGLWPVFLNPRGANFRSGYAFSLGGMADSFYEYFPKQHLLTGGLNQQYRTMYTAALKSLKEHIFFRPQTSDPRKMLIPGSTTRMPGLDDRVQPKVEHLGCFAGGMVALGAKVFRDEDSLITARELVNGCLWAYDSTPTGIMPENFDVVPCRATDPEECIWNQTEWFKAVIAHSAHSDSDEETNMAIAETMIQQRRLAPGVVGISDRRYLLRPEAIESVFVLYRITGDAVLQDAAWKMFCAIHRATKTHIAHAAIEDVMDRHSAQLDSMESFWTAETLKYFDLIFSEPDVVSLDDYVL